MTTQCRFATADRGAACSRRALLLQAAALGMSGCAARPPSAPVGTDGSTGAADAALDRLLADSDERTLDRNPVWGLYRGDLRRAAQHGEWLSDDWLAAERRDAEADLARLAALPRDALSPPRRLALDTAVAQRRMALRDASPPFGELAVRLPFVWYQGWHLEFAELSSGRSVAPYRTVKDYDDGLARIDGHIAFLDRAVARSREGLLRGIALPRFGVRHLVAQFEGLATQPRDASPFWAPIAAMPADMPATDAARLRSAYADAIGQRLRPAWQRVLQHLRDEALPGARESVGLSALPEGAAWYRHLVERHTTTTLDPEEIHRIGLAEVARIEREMAVVQAELGVAGPLKALFDHVRDAPALKPASAQALGDAYRRIGERVDAALPRLFGRRPATPLDIRPTPEAQAATDAGARYQSGSLEQKRPGVFFYNTHDLPSRSLHITESLYLHEAVPGHHFQISLTQENASLPPLLRFDGPTAYVEGWALYAESLGHELGLYADPYHRFGRLDHEMLRALRLVVDTGLHAQGFSREQAIDTLLAHSAMSRTDAVAEVERYIADPGQALAYKVGQMTISRLRADCSAALGARFDVRAFHGQVLDSGALPLGLLEAKLAAWVRTQRSA